MHHWSSVVYYHGPDVVDFPRCVGYTMTPVAATLVKHGADGFPIDGAPTCDFTALFLEFCDAMVNCTFSQAEFRQRATDSECDTNKDEIVLAYRCFTGWYNVASRHN